MKFSEPRIVDLEFQFLVEHIGHFRVELLQGRGTWLRLVHRLLPLLEEFPAGRGVSADVCSARGRDGRKTSATGTKLRAIFIRTDLLAPRTGPGCGRLCSGCHQNSAILGRDKVVREPGMRLAAGEVEDSRARLPISFDHARSKWRVR